MQGVSNQGPSKLRPKSAKGGTNTREIINGGRIAPSAGRKDRHSKVYTAKGQKDRRVRLSPNTAIQFYDVQDRLGYDSPSKAIDWLMKEAKAAIDALEASNHTENLNGAAILMQQSDQFLEEGLNFQRGRNFSKSACGINGQEYLNGNSVGNFGKFSTENGIVAPPSSTEFHAYPIGDLNSRFKIQASQGLSLSFHSCQDSSYIFSTAEQQRGLIPHSTPPHCETGSEVARFQKLLRWNSNSSNVKESQESVINSLPLNFPSQYDQSQLDFQREPLQSSFCPTILDPMHNHFSDSNYARMRFSDGDGLSGISTSARTLGLEEHIPVSSKPSSANSPMHYQD